MRELLEQKCQRRRALAALPFPEKVKIVEQMRETSARIRASAEGGRSRTQSAIREGVRPLSATPVGTH